MLVQPTLSIPPEIEARLSSGELFRYGSVVRETATGRIYDLLDEISAPAGRERAEKAVTRLAEKLKDPRVAVPALLIGTVVVFGLAQWKNRDLGAVDAEIPDLAAVPECVQRFNASLAEYIEAIRGARLSPQLLSQVLANLDAVKDYADPDGGIVVEFAFEHAVALLSVVADYTKQLADANNIDLAAAIQDIPGLSEIDALRRYIEVQKRIFANTG